VPGPVNCSDCHLKLACGRRTELSLSFPRLVEALEATSEPTKVLPRDMTIRVPAEIISFRLN
jgi:hypothetical protein